jgi:hypothetical protein
MLHTSTGHSRATVGDAPTSINSKRTTTAPEKDLSLCTAAAKTCAVHGPRPRPVRRQGDGPTSDSLGHQSVSQSQASLPIPSGAARQLPALDHNNSHLFPSNSVSNQIEGAGVNNPQNYHADCPATTNMGALPAIATLEMEMPRLT